MPSVSPPCVPNPSVTLETLLGQDNEATIEMRLLFLRNEDPISSLR